MAFSITTLEEGRFLDVNQVFEQRYGYSRVELVDHTVFELHFWEDLADRALLVAQPNHGSPVRTLGTRLRTKSGELKLTSLLREQNSLRREALRLSGIGRHSGGRASEDELRERRERA